MDRDTIYYKYRSLENFEYFIDILVNERFYATTYPNLNDAMEGLYYSQGLRPKVLREIKSAKEKFKICSFSKEKKDPLLWAHYANGSKGVCIGAQITGHYLDIEPINYKGLPTIKECIDANKTAREILTYKHKSWEYEKEVRVFIEHERGSSFVKVKIKEIILGERVSREHKELIKKLAEKILPDVKLIDYKAIK